MSDGKSRLIGPFYAVLDEQTQLTVAVAVDEAAANATADRHARQSGHEASVWRDDGHGARENTGYVAAERD